MPGSVLRSAMAASSVYLRPPTEFPPRPGTLPEEPPGVSGRRRRARIRRRTTHRRRSPMTALLNRSSDFFLSAEAHDAAVEPTDFHLSTALGRGEPAQGTPHPLTSAGRVADDARSRVATDGWGRYAANAAGLERGTPRCLLTRREVPRLCLGGSRSLTFSAVGPCRHVSYARQSGRSCPSRRPWKRRTRIGLRSVFVSVAVRPL